MNISQIRISCTPGVPTLCHAWLGNAHPAVGWPASSWNMFSLGCESPWINVMLWSKCVCVLEMASIICVFANETTASYSFSIVIVVCTYLLQLASSQESGPLESWYRVYRKIDQGAVFGSRWPAMPGAPVKTLRRPCASVLGNLM